MTTGIRERTTEEANIKVVSSMVSDTGNRVIVKAKIFDGPNEPDRTLSLWWNEPDEAGNGGTDQGDWDTAETLRMGQQIWARYDKIPIEQGKTGHPGFYRNLLTLSATPLEGLKEPTESKPLTGSSPRPSQPSGSGAPTQREPLNGMAWGGCQNNATTIITSMEYPKPVFDSADEARAWFAGEILMLAGLLYDQRPQ